MDVMALVIEAIGTITAVWLLLNIMQTKDQIQFRSRFSFRIREVRYTVTNKLNDDELAKILSETHLPIRPMVYQYLRFILTMLLLLCSIPLIHYSPMFLLLPLVTWLLLGYTKPLPMYWIFTFLKRLGIARRNKELFLLYGLVIQYLEVHPDSSVSVYDILRQSAPNLTVIQPALVRCITLWPRDPEAALTRFASEIATEQAKEFAEILRQIESSIVSTGLDTLNQRYDNFKEAQVAAYNVRLNIRSLFVFGLGLISLAVIGFNDVAIMMNYAQNLMKMSF